MGKKPAPGVALLVLAALVAPGCAAFQFDNCNCDKSADGNPAKTARVKVHPFGVIHNETVTTVPSEPAQGP